MAAAPGGAPKVGRAELVKSVFQGNSHRLRERIVHNDEDGDEEEEEEEEQETFERFNCDGEIEGLRTNQFPDRSGP